MTEVPLLVECSIIRQTSRYEAVKRIIEQLDFYDYAERDINIKVRVNGETRMVTANAIAASQSRPTKEAAQSWECKARPWVKSDPPQDCDWPGCGCDPYATKVIDALQECGMLAPAAPSASGRGMVAEGWQLVPAEANSAMWQAGKEADEHPGDSYSAVYRAMIASAPPAPADNGWLAVANGQLPDFEDPRVQTVYQLLCSNEMPPNSEEHWEGYIARRIVSLLAPAPSPDNGWLEEAMCFRAALEEICRCTGRRVGTADIFEIADRALRTNPLPPPPAQGGGK